MTRIDTQFLRALFDEEGSLHTTGRTALYRLYGPEGLLYVGISVSPLTRVRTHLRDQAWASEVIGVRIDYPDDPEAAEREAIWAERPRHNVVFNGSLPPPPPDRVQRLRVQLAHARQQLEGLESAVPESSAHLRLIMRGIDSKRAKIARLVGELAAQPGSNGRSGTGD
ncbi:GIY-YIG nuclease family protein [Streptomyces sp. NPDC057257]|uniref:GIY-YIG nuclease family protein n=1 Tax=Streptomyces sp. NPDC057257 TaxID=3346071 RepID=UPI003640B6DE